MPRTKSFDRTKVLKKAVDLFRKHGYHATSIQMLVDHLKINRASLYDTYGGKHALFMESLDVFMGAQIAKSEEHLSSNEDILSAVSAWLPSKSSDKHGCLVANTIAELTPSDRKVSARIHEHQQAMSELLKNRLNKAVDAGSLATDLDVETVCASLMVFRKGLQLELKRPQYDESLDDAKAMLLELLA